MLIKWLCGPQVSHWDETSFTKWRIQLPSWGPMRSISQPFLNRFNKKAIRRMATP